MSELFTNNAASRLAAGIGSGDTSLTVKTGEGALYPSPSGGDFFRLVLVNLSSGEWEIAFCTSRSGDVLTIQRAQEDAVGHPARAFDADDPVELRPTAGFFSSLTVTTTNIQSGTYNYGTDTGAANAYTVDLTPALVGNPPPNGMEVHFFAANSNTTASTLNINGQGAQQIIKNSGQLQANDIIANRLVKVIWNPGQTAWYLISDHNQRAPMGRRALAWLATQGPSAANSNISVGVGQDVVFDSVFEDPDNMWSGVNPERLTVPSWANTVRAYGQVHFNDATDTKVALIRKHYAVGSGPPHKIDCRQTGTGSVLNVTTPPIKVLPTDYFTLIVATSVLTTVDVLGCYTGNDGVEASTWLALEVLD